MLNSKKIRQNLFSKITFIITDHFDKLLFYYYSSIMSILFDYAWWIGGLVAALVGTLGLTTWFIPNFIYFFLRPQDLKKKYDATWAIVTG